MHLEQEWIERAVHGELSDRDAVVAEEHLASCPTCAARAGDVRRDEARVHELLQALDHPMPPPVPFLSGVTGPRVRSPRLRWAAAILMGLAVAGGAWAAPGSPLPGWVARLTGAAPGAGPTPSAEPRPGVTGAGDGGGLALDPGDDLAIVFRGLEEGLVRLLLTDDAAIQVGTASGEPRFTSGLDLLVVEHTGADPVFEIRVPRAAPRIEVRQGERAVWVKEGERITTDGSVDAQGVYRVPLSPGG